MPKVYLQASSGQKANLGSAAIINGQLKVAVDSQELYLDIDNTRIHVSKVVTDYTEAQIKAKTTGILPKMYLSSDTHLLFWYSTSESKWVQINGEVSEAAHAEKATKDNDGNVITTTYYTIDAATTYNTALESRLDTMDSTIAAINSFEIRVVQNKSDLPSTNQQTNILWFVASTNTSGNVYDEYVYVWDDDQKTTGHYEMVGTTETRFENYYTKTEVDNKETAINNAIGTDSTSGTVKGRITAAEDDIDDLEDAVGTYVIDSTAAGYKGTISTRLDTIEAGIGDEQTAESIKGRINTAEGDIDDLQAAVGTYEIDTTDPDYKGTISDRLDTLETNQATDESDIDDLQAAVGTYEIDTTDPDYKGTISDRLDTAETNIGSLQQLHPFNKSVVAELPAVANADPYTIYFVPEAGLTGSDKKYAEYMYLAEAFTYTYEDEDHQSHTVTIPAGYQRIDSTVDFLNYYTKSEIDSTVQNINQTVAGHTQDISNLTTTVNNNKQAQDSKNTALDNTDTEINAKIGTDYAASTATGFKSINTRLGDLEDAVGTYEIDTTDPDYKGTISSRLDAAETAITTNDSAMDARVDELEAAMGTYETDSTDPGYKGTVSGRLDSVETAIGTDSTAASVKGRISALETALGTVDDSDPSTSSALERISDLEDAISDSRTGLEARISAAEDDIDDLESALGTYVIDSSASGYKGTVSDRLDTAESDVDDLESAVGTYVIDSTSASYKGTIANRLDTLETNQATDEGDIDDLEAALGTYVIDSTAAGYKGTVSGRLDSIETAIGTDSTANTVKGRIKGLEDNLAQELLDRAAADTALGGRIDGLVTTIGNINRFEIEVLDVNDSLPVTGDEYTIYFVPLDNDYQSNNYTKYAEYMWISVIDEQTGTDNGYYEEIGITEADLTKYYTKTEVDAKETAINNAIGTDSTAGTIKGRIKAAEDAIGTINNTTIPGVVSDYQSADTGLGNRLTEVEAKLGATMDASTTSGFQSVDARLDTVETSIGDDNTANSIKGRIKATEDAIGTDSTAASVKGRISALETALGTVDDSDPSTSSALERISDLEDAVGANGLAADVAEINAKIGSSYPDSTDSGFVSIGARLTSLENKDTSLDGDIADEATARANADDALDGRLDILEAHSFNYAGSQSEGGAADNVVQTSNSDNAYKDVLFGTGTNHDEVGYNTKATFNPSTGDLKVTSVTLGAATIVYNTTTATIDFNFA